MKKIIVFLILFLILPINVFALSCANYPTCFNNPESAKEHFAGMLTDELIESADSEYGVETNRKGCLLTGECSLYCGYQSDVKDFEVCYGASFEKSCATGYTVDAISILYYPKDKMYAIAYDFKVPGSSSYSMFVSEKFNKEDLFNKEDKGLAYNDFEGVAYIKEDHKFFEDNTCPNYVYINEGGFLNTVFDEYIWGDFCFDDDYVFCKEKSKGYGYHYHEDHRLQLKHSYKDDGNVNVDSDTQHVDKWEEYIEMPEDERPDWDEYINDYEGNEDYNVNFELKDLTCDYLFKGNNDNYNITYKLVKSSLKFMQYIGIVLALVLSVIDFFKVLPSQDKSLLKKSATKAATRLGIAIAIFFVPSLLGFLLDLMGIPTCDIL